MHKSVMFLHKLNLIDAGMQFNEYCDEKFFLFWQL